MAGKDDKTDAPDRDKDYSGQKAVRDHLLKLYTDIEKGFTDANDRINDTMDYWDIYNCKLGSKQFYTGTSKIFVPIVHNAVNARKTRFVNQFFPISGRHIEVTSEDGTLPHAEMALAEHYVRKARLREKVPAMLKNGDVEGHITVYVRWREFKRDVAMRVQRPVSVNIDGMSVDVEDEKPVEDIKQERIVDAYPDIEIISDSDLIVLPAVADSLEDAIAQGGSVTIQRRLSKAALKKLIDDGEVDKGEGDALLKEMTTRKPATTRKDPRKEIADAAGIKHGNLKHALLYETWTNVKIEGEWQLCKVWFGGADKLLGCKRNPLWCDRLPIVSAPLEKVAGSFRGMSKVKFCQDMQYAANDAVNEGMDSAAYALMPIVMTDPVKNPRVGSMVLATAAIWETSPQDTNFVQFPQLWKEAFEIVNAARAEIASVLSLNPASITQQTGKKKLNQAEIAAETQIDILSTADVVTVLEESVMTPILRLFMELDHQYRDKDLLVREYGEIGIKATMQAIPPLQMDRRYQFRWFGVEAQRAAQQIQLQIASLNVIRGIPPQQYPGYQLNLTPVITHMVETVFGPRLAPLVFRNMAEELSVKAEEENAMMVEGFDIPVHPMDDDKQHLQEHMKALKETQDPTGMIRAHMMRHVEAMKMKQAAAIQMQQNQAGGQPGMPGGAGPGVAGTPRAGAVPGQPRPAQQPPGVIHQDRMVDAGRVPR